MAERPCPREKTIWRSLIIRDLDDAIVVLDTQRRIVDLNPSALRLAGVEDARPFLGEQLDRLFPTLGDVPCPVDRGESIRRELTMEGETGVRHLILRVTPLYEAGRCLGCLLTLRDVTEQKRIEAELQTSEARYRTLVESAQVGVFCIGADYRFTYVNDEMSRIFGLPRDQLIGRDFRDFISEEVRAVAEKHYLDRRAGRPAPAVYEIAVRAADGVIRYVKVRIGLVEEADGSLQSVGQCLDVTRYREIEEELRRHRQYLEQLVEERTWELIHLNVQLAESEERLRVLVNATPDIVGFKDGAGRWLLINEAGLHILRLDEIAYRGKRSAELALLDDFHRRIFAADEAGDVETWRAGTVTRCDMHIPLPDGSVRIYDVIRVPIFYPDGRRRGIVIIGRDVTARVQAEEEVRRHRKHLGELVAERTKELLRVNARLAESEARLAMAIEAGGALVVEHSVDLQEISIDPAYLRLWGVHPGDLPERRRFATWFRSRVHPQDRPCLEAVYRRLLSGQLDRYEVEFRLLRQEHMWRWVRAVGHALTRDDNGRPTRFVGLIFDITKAKEMEEALRASELKFRNIVAQLPDGIVLTDREGRIVEWNQSQERITGIPASRAVGQKLWEVLAWLLPPEQRSSDLLERVRYVAQRVFLSGELPDTAQTQHRDKRVWRPDGTYRYVRVQPFPVDTGEDRLIGSIVTDVTPRREMEEALRRRNLELETLATIVAAITSTLSLEQVLQRIVNATYEFFPGLYSATLQLLDKDGKLHIRAAAGRTPPSEMALVFDLGEGIAGWTLQAQRLIYVPDVSQEPRFVPGVQPVPYRSIMSAPLIAQEQRLGTLCVTAMGKDAFTAEDRAALLTLASYAAIAVQNARLYEQVQRDAETKTMLLQEVNHRVKNNLATIIGLLYAERRHISTQERTHQAVLDELISRIQGLATVHSMLSDSAWEPLLLSELVAQVIRPLLGTQAARKRVEVQVTPSPVRVNSRQASVLALVFNELTTNVIKYVLPVQEETRIVVTIEQEGNARVRCMFRDNGPGYPDDVLKGGRANVGLYLVKTLVARDLNGKLEMYNDGGAVVAMRFAVQ